MTGAPLRRAPVDPGSGRRRRLDRLRDELVDARVAFPVVGDVGDRLLEEIDHARFPRTHENRVASYGCVVPLGGVLGPVPGGQRLGLGGLSVELARSFADGRSSFLVRSDHGGSLLCRAEGGDDEASLIALATAADAYVVHRSGSGQVRVLSFGSVATWHGVEWVSKPRADRFAPTLRQLIGEHRDEVVVGLLTLCTHWLSPARCGAVLAWLADGDEPGGLERPRCGAPALDVTDPAHYGAFVSMLTQTDGAALIAGDGRLVGYGVGLLFSDEARRAVPAESGSRHTAARRYSYENPGTVLFVTSEDGPVSVYAGGARVLVFGGPSASEVGQPSPQHRNRSGQNEVPCDGCGRVLLVRLPGQDTADVSGLRCPACRPDATAVVAHAPRSDDHWSDGHTP